MSSIIIVDENDNVIGNKPRSEVDAKKLRYRVSGLWIKNSKNEHLLARRAYTKTHHPGKWGPAVAGTVEEGETYEDNIIKEAEEELGLENLKLRKSKKIYVSAQYSHFTQWFITFIDKPINFFKIQKEEVAEIKWFSRNELTKALKINPDEFLPKMNEYFEMFDCSDLDNFNLK